MGSHLSRRSVGHDLESFELDHLRSIKLGANEKSEIKKKKKIIDLQTVIFFKKYKSDPRTVQKVHKSACCACDLALDSQFLAFFSNSTV